MGLHKTLMSYSDQMWENSIKMIKYMTKRGAKFDGTRINTFTLKSVQPNDFDGEVEALAISLDMWKRQAIDVKDRIKQAMHKHNDSHFDPSVSPEKINILSPNLKKSLNVQIFRYSDFSKKTSWRSTLRISET